MIIDFYNLNRPKYIRNIGKIHLEVNQVVSDFKKIIRTSTHGNQFTFLFSNLLCSVYLCNNDNDNRIYTGATELNWKNRMYNLNLSFTNKKYANSTRLSKYVWQIKDKTRNSTI